MYRKIGTERKEPDGSNLENCAILTWDHESPTDLEKWKDVPCAISNIHYYLCEYALEKNEGT